MRERESRLVAAILGAVLATTLLCAAFAVSAREPGADGPQAACPRDPGARAQRRGDRRP